MSRTHKDRGKKKKFVGCGCPYCQFVHLDRRKGLVDKIYKLELKNKENL